MAEHPRRRFLAAAAGSIVAGQACTDALHAGERPKLTQPLPGQLAWQDCELGLVYHFDMPVYLPGGWRWNPAYRKTLDPNAYHPTKLDTDQWLAAAKAMGAGYAIFTATHMGGFLQWQTDLYPYGLKQTRWRDGKGDVVKDFVESCRRAGIKPGLYVSLRFNAFWQVAKQRVNWGKGDDPDRQAKYVRVCEQMVAELCSRYGQLIEFWFDGGTLSPEEGGPDVLPIVDRHQPNMVFYHSPQRMQHRWIGNEAGVAGYPCWATMPSPKDTTRSHRRADRKLLAHGDPNGTAWMPAMCDAPLRNHEWFWRPKQDHKLYPLASLVNMYYKSVGRNCNLILGATPNRDGLIPEADFRRLEELGKLLRQRFGKPVGQTAGAGETVELPLPQPQRIDHVVIMEDIAHGERVRQYVVEGRVPGGAWQKLCDGISVGHKRIQPLEPVEVARLRLRCTKAVAQPRIRKLAACRSG